MTTLVILVMVFLFVGFRLWSVLGRRTGHEQTIARPAEAAPPSPLSGRPVPDAVSPTRLGGRDPVDPRAADGVRAIVSADPYFDALQFIEGAKGAYRMILEAFWRGDEETLARLTDDSVRQAFAGAIAARNAAGEVLENRLVSIESAVIDRASLDGQMANVTVRFDADIAAVTRNAAGDVVAGSTSDAVPTHDLWTFSRHVGADDPNWVLIETDEAA